MLGNERKIWIIITIKKQVFGWKDDSLIEEVFKCSLERFKL